MIFSINLTHMSWRPIPLYTAIAPRIKIDEPKDFRDGYKILTLIILFVSLLIFPLSSYLQADQVYPDSYSDLPTSLDYLQGRQSWGEYMCLVFELFLS